LSLDVSAPSISCSQHARSPATCRSSTSSITQERTSRTAGRVASSKTHPAADVRCANSIQRVGCLTSDVVGPRLQEGREDRYPHCDRHITSSACAAEPEPIPVSGLKPKDDYIDLENGSSEEEEEADPDEASNSRFGNPDPEESVTQTFACTCHMHCSVRRRRRSHSTPSLGSARHRRIPRRALPAKVCIVSLVMCNG
jgi:hypothetical protein